MSIESPDHEVVSHEGSFELRRYDPYVTANVRVRADGYNEAANAGFRTLAGYIFGANHARDEIAMTAPVNTSRLCCQKIAMTAPVTSGRTEEDYVVSFTCRPRTRRRTSFPHQTTRRSNSRWCRPV